MKKVTITNTLSNITSWGLYHRGWWGKEDIFSIDESV